MTRKEKNIIAEKTATAWERLKYYEYINLIEPNEDNDKNYRMYLFIWSAFDEICSVFNIQYKISDRAKRYSDKIFELI